MVNGYATKIVASGKILGPWGNPDVVGIQVLDMLGTVHLHMASVEVKLNSETWQRNIFEAISHRRYLDRCYFCYPVLVNNREISDEMRDYAQLYCIEVLLIDLAEGEIRKLNEGFDLDPANLSITEVCPAPYSPVLPKYRRDALQALAITNLQELYPWGKRANI
jgi:hypothetical protein